MEFVQNSIPPPSSVDPDSGHLPSHRFTLARAIASTPTLIASGNSVHASTISARSAGSAGGATGVSGSGRVVIWVVIGGRSVSFRFASVREDGIECS